MALRAVLLGFDGVIADTENHHIAAWQRTLAALGWQVPDEVAARSADVDDREFLRDLLAAQQITDGDIDGWVRKKQTLTISMLRDAPGFIPASRSWSGSYAAAFAWLSSPAPGVRTSRSSCPPRACWLLSS